MNILKEFTSNSGNIASVIVLDKDVFRLIWKNKPTRQDMDEITEFFKSVVYKDYSEVEVTENVGIATEAKALKEWKNKT
jgi:hypothetical protein